MPRKNAKNAKECLEGFGFLRSLHCYPSISRSLAKIFSAASTQRRKDAKTQRGKCMVIWASVPNLCALASLRLCVKFPRWRLAALGNPWLNAFA